MNCEPFFLFKFKLTSQIIDNNEIYFFSSYKRNNISLMTYITI